MRDKAKKNKANTKYKMARYRNDPLYRQKCLEKTNRCRRNRREREAEEAFQGYLISLDIREQEGLI